MNLKVMEEEYLATQGKFYLWLKLLSEFSRDELNDFIQPFLQEYKKLNQERENELKEAYSRYENITEIEKYFIGEMSNIFGLWVRVKYLEEILNDFNIIVRRLFPKKYSKSSKFKDPIDVQSISIIQVLRFYIHLPDNVNKNIKCPFPWHPDKSPSFKIYKKTNSFYCFWCHKGGNSIKLIGYMENLDNKQAWIKFQEEFNTF